MGGAPYQLPAARQAVRIARSILDGTTPLYLGCKQLIGPLGQLGVHHLEPFIAIASVDSQTDDAPVWPQERQMWDGEQLARKDAELAEWLPQIQDRVLEACRTVIERFGA